MSYRFRPSLFAIGSVLALSAGCGLIGEGTVGSDAGAFSYGGSFDPGNPLYCSAPRADGCGIGGSGFALEGLTQNLKALRLALGKIQSGVGEETSACALLEGDEARKAACAQHLKKYTSAYLALIDNGKLRFEPRDRLPENTVMTVKLEREQGQTRYLYFALDAVESRLRADPNGLIALLATQLGHMVDVPYADYPLGVIRGTDPGPYEAFRADAKPSATLLSWVANAIVLHHGRYRTYDDVVRSLAPLAYYPLRETTGTSVQDVSGNQFYGTLHGAFERSASGPFPHDSTSRSVRFTSAGAQSPSGIVGDIPSLDSPGLNSIAVEFWLRWPGAASRSVSALVSFNPAGLFLTGDFIGFATLNEGGPFIGTSSRALVDRWTHVVANFHRNMDFNRLYLNGKRVPLERIGLSPPWGGWVPGATFARRFSMSGFLSMVTGDGSKSLGGNLASIAFYNRALGPRTAFAHYAMGMGTFRERLPDTAATNDNGAEPTPGPQSRVVVYRFPPPSGSYWSTPYIPWLDQSSEIFPVGLFRTEPTSGTTQVWQCVEGLRKDTECVGGAALPVGYLFTGAASGRKALYECVGPAPRFEQMIARSEETCVREQFTVRGIFGYDDADF